MISKIIINNFECHKDITIDLDNNLSLITGYTRSGKSSILRALQWLLTSTLIGDSFVSHATDCTRVTIILTDKTIITKERKKGKNRYSLNKTVISSGSSIPEEIQNILNIQNINIQSQFDQHFLLTSSSIERVKLVNEITGMSDIDNSLKNINTMKKHTEKLKIFNRDSYDKLKREKSNYSNIGILKDELKTLQKEKDVIDKLKIILNKYKNYIVLNQNINKYKNIKNVENSINNLVIICKDFEKAKLELLGLNKIYSNYKSNINNIEKFSNEKVQLENNFKKEFPDVCPLCTTIITKEKLNGIIK